MNSINPESGLCDQLERLLLQELSPEQARSSLVWEAARYSLLAGGKRVRPRLLFAAGSLLGPLPPEGLPLAAALEMVHTYSLIHDDLPSMDNDDYRRGRPACHRVYGEARAILAGDLLLNRAYELMLGLGQEKPRDGVLRAARILAEAAGGEGMILGQDKDLALEEMSAESVDLSDVLLMAELKTSRLIRAALLMGGSLADAGEAVMEQLALAGTAAGIAFQIKDDILDCVSNRDTLGKTPHKDQEAGKKTFVSTAGIKGASALLGDKAAEIASVLGKLKGMGCETSSLESLMRYLLERKN